MHKKPKKCCYPDCFNCVYDDCINSNITKEEILVQDKYDKNIVDDITRMNAIGNKFYKYNHSNKGQVRAKKYQSSTKGKDALARYNSSEKGKARQRAYYYRKKAERELLLKQT